MKARVVSTVPSVQLSSTIDRTRCKCKVKSSSRSPLQPQDEEENTVFSPSHHHRASYTPRLSKSLAPARPAVHLLRTRALPPPLYLPHLSRQTGLHRFHPAGKDPSSSRTGTSHQAQPIQHLRRASQAVRANPARRRPAGPARRQRCVPSLSALGGNRAHASELRGRRVESGSRLRPQVRGEGGPKGRRRCSVGWD